jgi:sugar lactone lactonase YvrE
MLNACHSPQTDNQENSMQEAVLVHPANAQLGEGALWNPRDQMLLWIDIEGMKLHLYKPDTRHTRTIVLPQRIGTVVPTDQGHVLVALHDGIYHLNLSDESLKAVAQPEANLPENRFNDGKCDPAGRLWAGTMSMNGVTGAAKLYSFEADGSFTARVDSVSISNGIVWSLDHSKMYYIDTPTRQVKEYDYNIENGDIRFARVAVHVPDSLGYPDGMTIDREGMVWIGMWDGGCVTRWNPASGELLSILKVPGACNVTSCAFGGQGLDTLYITTAKAGLSEEQLKQYPASGGLFSAVPGVKGVPAFFFREGFQKK